MFSKFHISYLHYYVKNTKVSEQVLLEMCDVAEKISLVQNKGIS